MAVPDTLYQQNGINSIEDLINTYTDEPDSITQLQNDFYRYMEYHCLGGTYYLSQLEGFSYDAKRYFDMLLKAHGADAPGLFYT